MGWSEAQLKGHETCWSSGLGQCHQGSMWRMAKRDSWKPGRVQSMADLVDPQGHPNHYNFEHSLDANVLP